MLSISENQIELPVPSLRNCTRFRDSWFCPGLSSPVHVTLVGLTCLLPSIGASGFPDVPIRTIPDCLVGHTLLSPSGRFLFRYNIRLRVRLRRCPLLSFSACAKLAPAKLLLSTSGGLRTSRSPLLRSPRSRCRPRRSRPLRRRPFRLPRERFMRNRRLRLPLQRHLPTTRSPG